MDDGMAIEFIHGCHDAVLEFLFGCDADVAQDRAGDTAPAARGLTVVAAECDLSATITGGDSD